MTAASHLDLSRATWRKSRRSNNGGACVEVASVPGWRKSRRSNNGGNCVEVATTASVVAVRDSKDPHGPALAVPGHAWRTFTAQVKAGSHHLA
jgi:Domain of unknown function (DUF397)